MDFITTTASMVKLGLSLRERVAFSIIYSFSQEGEGCWWGSLPTMAEWLDCSKRHAIEVLKKLQFEGLIEKREIFENGVKRCMYYATPEAVKLLHQGGEISSPGVVKSVHQGGELSSPNNKDRYIKRDTKGDSIYTPSPKFDFRQALLTAGVSEDTADAWLAVRKAKRSVNTEIAWSSTLNEIRKSGKSAEACIRECVARSWAGFKAEWLEREQAQSQEPKSNMQQIWERIQARDNGTYRSPYETTFNPNDLPYDEQ